MMLAVSMFFSGWRRLGMAPAMGRAFRSEDERANALFDTP
jgi:hypothetical protein